jgi:hypothetical protein
VIRLEFEAPYPPSTNNLYRTVVANGRPVRVKTGKAKEYGQAVGQRVGIALARAGATPQPPYALHLSVWMPDAARRDLSRIRDWLSPKSNASRRRPSSGNCTTAPSR